ncbi:hypothetical protein C7M84_019111 [Penaeus vannamei]|uniref:Uncharacterized protein n=1 Tax=Penaeus vannamei TaxID=6689 RepID=A0A423SFQ7_PENVA|nr:hypothetical protein C7M84_019111 [Penaeus vannamei]
MSICGIVPSLYAGSVARCSFCCARGGLLSFTLSQRLVFYKGCALESAGCRFLWSSLSPPVSLSPTLSPLLFPLLLIAVSLGRHYLPLFHSSLLYPPLLPPSPPSCCSLGSSLSPPVSFFPSLSPLLLPLLLAALPFPVVVLISSPCFILPFFIALPFLLLLVAVSSPSSSPLVSFSLFRFFPTLSLPSPLSLPSCRFLSLIVSPCFILPCFVLPYFITFLLPLSLPSCRFLSLIVSPCFILPCFVLPYFITFLLPLSLPSCRFLSLIISPFLIHSPLFYFPPSTLPSPCYSLVCRFLSLTHHHLPFCSLPTVLIVSFCWTIASSLFLVALLPAPCISTLHLSLVLFPDCRLPWSAFHPLVFSLPPFLVAVSCPSSSSPLNSPLYSDSPRLPSSGLPRQARYSLRQSSPGVSSPTVQQGFPLRPISSLPLPPPLSLPFPYSLFSFSILYSLFPVLDLFTYFLLPVLVLYYSLFLF